MDRDVSLLLLTTVTSIKTALQTIATNTTPSVANVSREYNQQFNTHEEILNEVAENNPDPDEIETRKDK